MLEALATGVPTICTDCPVGGPRTFIRDGENGLLIPINNPRELCNAMNKVVNDENLSKRFSRNSVKIREKLDLHTIFLKWEKVVHGEK